MKIRCNWCMSIFNDVYIQTHEDNPDENNDEYCPVCGQSGYLMDNPVDTETINKLREMAERLLIVYQENTLGDILDINIGITSLIDKLKNKNNE